MNHQKLPKILICKKACRIPEGTEVTIISSSMYPNTVVKVKWGKGEDGYMTNEDVEDYLCTKKEFRKLKLEKLDAEPGR